MADLIRNSPAVRLWLSVSAVALVLSAELAREVVTHTGLTRFDPAVTQWIAEHRTGSLNALASTLTWVGSSFLIIPIGLGVGAFLWFRRRQWVPLVMLAVAFLGAAAIYDVLKPAVGRLRPAAPLQVGGPDGGFAFPSGHTTQSTAFYGMLAIVLMSWLFPGRRPQVAIGAGILILIVGATRLYLGVHWLTDVLGGFAIGLTWLATTMSMVAARGWATPSIRQTGRHSRQP